MTGEEPALPTVRLHGRAPQLSRVRAWWHQPPAHRTALLVAGEPGLGRTAVLRWAARVLGAGSTGHLVALRHVAAVFADPPVVAEAGVGHRLAQSDRP
ncbi:hypothetical protein AB0L08_28650, partial [Streptomyces albidoflavus]|uniref:hypothetical protein n=1 Tax=Streptomyces albidoflavus TaxID=1886 RepID=UPI00341888BE